MISPRWFNSLIVCATVALLGGPTAQAQTMDESVEPYRMLRSLQFVQDTVVRGDHSASDMQRFMLATIDERLRAADPAVFSDPRNVDATLIYAMSGGNPATLEFLVARDINGNFDNRVTDALRKYLSGKGTTIANTLATMATEYKNTDIAPYLALVAGNVLIPKDPEGALKMYDWARLSAPGTVVEEAALRRSLAVAVDAKIATKAAGYANRYARRFLYSPYASQFADLFVRLVVEQYETLTLTDIEATLGYMDIDRRREVYLRVARHAAIAGRKDLATMASQQALLISGGDQGAEALPKLYGSIVGVPTDKVSDAMAALMEIPDEALSERDRALRKAAQFMAKEVLRKPQLSPPMVAVAEPVAVSVEPSGPDADLQDPLAPAPEAAAPGQSLSENAEQKPDPSGLDPAMRTFVDSGRSKLDAIDALLQKESP